LITAQRLLEAGHVDKVSVFGELSASHAPDIDRAERHLRADRCEAPHDGRAMPL
jgi:hypothetical protein